MAAVYRGQNLHGQINWQKISYNQTHTLFQAKQSCWKNQDIQWYFNSSNSIS